MTPDRYPPHLIASLEAVWGEGFLAPGGAEEVARVLDGHDLSGKSVLDIGCGAGGIDVALVANHGAGYVTGIDQEDSVLTRAREVVLAHGLQHRIGLAKVAPGPLTFPSGSFDVVFSRDAILHLPDKIALMAEIARVLKQGGWFLASDWLTRTDEVSPQMTAFLAAEGLDSGLATPARYAAAMVTQGFTDLRIASRNAGYRDETRRDLARLQGADGTRAAALVGQDFVDHTIARLERMIPVLDSGELCPTHLAGRRP